MGREFNLIIPMYNIIKISYNIKYFNVQYNKVHRCKSSPKKLIKYQFGNNVFV